MEISREEDEGKQERPDNMKKAEGRAPDRVASDDVARGRPQFTGKSGTRSTLVPLAGT
jgi:hypothetical protein